MEFVYGILLCFIFIIIIAVLTSDLKIMKKTIFTILAIISCIIIVTSWSNRNRDTFLLEDSVPVKLVQPEFFLHDVPTDSLVLQACEYYGIKHANIVLAQAILETGHYRSGGCKYDNNLFGLYNSRKHEFFKFEKWYESVEAYRDMIQYRYNGEEDYYQWLEKIGYAEDPNYTNKLKQIIKIYNIK